MYQMFNHMEAVEVGKKIKLNEYVTLELHNNNHVVGATSISLYIRKPNNNVVHILYSSDMGNSITQDMKPFLKSNELPHKCNLFISEATYNNKERSFTKKDAIQERKWLKEYITQKLQENKRILFATFSFSRTQEILQYLFEEFKNEEWFKEIPIVLDGQLMYAINSTYIRTLDDEDREYFEKIMSMKNIKINRYYDGTVATLAKRTKGIYLAASGFCAGGRVITYLQSFLGNKSDCVILTGFSGGEGSIGWKIATSDQKTVTIDKQVIKKCAEVYQLKTWSSHVGYDELMSIFAGMHTDRILIHHSDDGKEQFCKEAMEYLRNRGITTPVIPVEKGSCQFIL